MPEIKFDNVMDESKLSEINAALEGIKFAKQEIVKAKRAGIDVAAQETAANDAEQRLLKIKGVYFPGR